MDMRDLIIPQQLSTLLENAKGFQAVHTPRLNVKKYDEAVIREDEITELPSNIDLHPFSRFVREQFRDHTQWGILTRPLRSSITKSVSDADSKAAIILSRLILRHMMDKSMKGAEIKLFSDYVANMVLLNYDLRDEALAQTASLTWKNYTEEHQNRIWVLLSHFLSCISPSHHLNLYLLKYVSDHGGNYSAFLQQKLLRMPQISTAEESRLFPPCVLEWQSNTNCIPMAIKVFLSDNSTFMVEVNSWTTAEEAANRALQQTLGSNVQGWSLALENENGEIVEIAGHEYLFDLFSSMELFPELETPRPEFLVYRSKTGGNPSFDPSEFLHAGNPPKKQPADRVPRSQSSKSNKPPKSPEQQVDSTFSGNFSYGPPNIKISHSGYDRKTSIHDMHANPYSGRVDAKGVSKRIKGGGRMMQPMGMGGMMMQPQMTPMMQSPMMQPQMMPMQPQMMPMQPQMMPMQSPMMQPQMMQPQMMQPQMMQPQMMQPQMAMNMPSSIGMMSSAMDGGKQQNAMQEAMEKLIKQQEEQQKNIKRLLQEKKKGKDDFDSDDENSYRRRSSRRDGKRRDWRDKRHSSNEDRRRSSRRHDRDSSEEDRGRRRSPHKVAGAAAVTWKKDSPVKTKQSQSGHLKSPSPEPEKFQRSYAKKKEQVFEDSDDDEDIPISEDGQGTVRMSFSEKQRFFQAKASQEKKTPPRRQPPAKIALPKADKKTSKVDSDKETGEVETPEIQRAPAWKPPPKKPENDAHEEALRKIKEAKKKSEEQNKTKTEEAALLSRQRREAARKGSTTQEARRSPSPQPAPPPRPQEKVYSRLEPQRLAALHEALNSPKTKPDPFTPTSSPEDSPRHSPEPAANVALAAALAARHRSQQQQPEPPIVPPPLQLDRREPPPIPPPLEDPVALPVSSPGLSSDADTKTVLYPRKHKPFFIYTNVKWRLLVRKEVFHSGEYIKDAKMAQLVFRQIGHEARNGNPRIAPADREDIKHRITGSDQIEPSAMRSILQTCKENWPLYFTQTFGIKIREIPPDFPRVLYQANTVGVGQTGVHFFSVNGATEWKPVSYDFNTVSSAKELTGGIIELYIQGRSLKLHCRRSNHLRRVILPYLVSIPKRQPMSPVAPRMIAESFSGQDDMSLHQSDISEDVYEVLPPPSKGKFSLWIFGEKHFRKKHDLEKALQHSKIPLGKTLIEVNEIAIAEKALECYGVILQFMGDAPTKATNDDALLFKFIGICNKNRENEFLRDEVCIYLAKQTTNNKKQSSCVRGWRMFSLFLAYFSCSENLMPHLLAHLHEAEEDKSDPINSKGAAVCLVNLQQTITYGGRQKAPSDVELKALMVGRTSFEQIFHIPGMTDAKFKVNTTSVIKLAVEHFCAQLGIKNEDEMKEYGIFAVTMDQNNKMVDILPQKRNVYILDTLNQLKRQNTRGMFTFQRVVWKQPINYDNERLVQMLFQQVVPEYVDGKFLTYRELTENLTKAQIGEMAKISALCHRGIVGSSLPSQEEVLMYIPRKVLQQRSDFTWKELAQNQFTSVQNIPQHQARSEVLALLVNKKLFGAAFFNAEIAGESGSRPNMVAVDAKGFYVLEIETHRIEGEHALSAISSVENRVDQATKMTVCDISIQSGSGVRLVTLITRKAALIAGVINHHLAVVRR